MKVSTRLSGNPFSTINFIETAQELLDIAFNRAMKIKTPALGKVSRSVFIREFEKNRVNTAANVLGDRLLRMVNQFPTLDMVHPFYVELTDVLIGMDELKKALGRIYGAAEVIRNVAVEMIAKIEPLENPDEMKAIRGKSFGRLSSIVYNLESSLALLETARTTLALLPGFDPTQPSVVVAGVPNVGKSSFVSAATTGKPEIAAYPFTTKKLVFGHLKMGFLSVQFCDTPGLLDRSLNDRNEIELQAVAALKHISDILLIIIDPAITATYSVADQLKLVDEFVDFYPAAELLLVVNKVDLLTEVELTETKRLVYEFLEEYGMQQEDIEATPFISSLKKVDITKVIERLEYLVKFRVIASPKFKVMTKPEISEDFLKYDELPEDQYKKI